MKMGLRPKVYVLSSFSYILEVRRTVGLGEENGGQNPNQVGSFADESVSDEADDESCAEQSQIDSADSSAGTRNPAVYFPVVVESTELAHFAP